MTHTKGPAEEGYHYLESPPGNQVHLTRPGQVVDHLDLPVAIILLLHVLGEPQSVLHQKAVTRLISIVPCRSLNLCIPSTNKPIAEYRHEGATRLTR